MRNKLFTIVALVLVVGVALMIANPFAKRDLKDPKAYDSYQAALAQNRPVFIMFTSDT
jgi:hypothetical protein